VYDPPEIAVCTEALHYHTPEQMDQESSKPRSPKKSMKENVCRNYDVMGYAFAPCDMTTYGQIHGHLLRLLYVLAKKQAETVHVHKRPFTHIEHLFGLFFAQSRARIGAAVARGMALRAMGCSLMGVSKVFLRHVAPTRYGDQTLAAGEHLAPGFSQWRLALAA
jgi:hypothetical protein